MIIVVDLDNTLTLNNNSEIEKLIPNNLLIERLQNLNKSMECTIKIVTARGQKSKLTLVEKEKKYKSRIEKWLSDNQVPYHELSFNKEYADLYIDDKTISPTQDFYAIESYFTGNRILFTNQSVIKYCKTAISEYNWYVLADKYSTAKVLFYNEDCIITERVYHVGNPNVREVVYLLDCFRSDTKISDAPYETYTKHIHNELNRSLFSDDALKIADTIHSYEHEATFFHGDFSVTNLLQTDTGIVMIDPAFKSIFGSYLTDAGKAYFSYIAYSFDFESADKIKQMFGADVIRYAVCEGMRVSKYKKEYASIVNNIADLCTK